MADPCVPARTQAGAATHPGDMSPRRAPFRRGKGDARHRGSLRGRFPGLLAAMLLMPWLGHAAAAKDALPALDTPLTDVPGDPVRGLAIVRDARNATCLICHDMPIPEEPSHGNLGPPLDGVGDRFSTGELRQRVVDAKRINPDTIMPAYYRTEGLYRVYAPYAGKTIYTAQQVEDVVAYLLTLRAH